MLTNKWFSNSGLIHKIARNYLDSSEKLDKDAVGKRQINAFSVKSIRG